MCIIIEGQGGCRGWGVREVWDVNTAVGLVAGIESNWRVIDEIARDW